MRYSAAKLSKFHTETPRAWSLVPLIVCLLAIPVLAQSPPSGGLAPVLTLTPGLASTVAGTGTSGYSGDGGPARQAQFHSPIGIARDAQGNLYVADIENDVIRKISAGGTVTTVAGNGSLGYTGDGGPATNAQLFWPVAVAVDTVGNLYIADWVNACVRKVDLNGVISTLATSSGPPVRGVTADLAGNVFFSSSLEGVWKVDSAGATTKIAGTGEPGFSGDGGRAADAQTSGVAGLAVDNQGNLYLAEVYNSDVRRVDTNGIITTVAGDQQFGYAGDGGPATSARFNGPTDVRLDAAGNLYIVDSSNNRIRKVNASGTISTIAGDGNGGYAGDGNLATITEFAGPGAIALDEIGNLLVADIGNNVIRGIRVDSTALDFGTVSVGQTGGPILVVVSNAGNADLNLSSLAISASFGAQSTCVAGRPLSPGSDCSVAVSFTPALAGNITGTLILNDDTAGTPHTITLKGQGRVVRNPDFTISMSASSLNVGQSGSGTISTTVMPTNGFTGAISLSCSGLPSHSTCSFLPASLLADGSNGALPAVVTISTGVSTVAVTQHEKGPVFLAATGGFSAGVLGFVFAIFGEQCYGKLNKRRRVWQLMPIAIILCGGLVGCGTIAPGQSHLTPAGNYTVTITAASTGLSHSTTFALAVAIKTD